MNIYIQELKHAACKIETNCVWCVTDLENTYV